MGPLNAGFSTHGIQALSYAGADLFAGTNSGTSWTAAPGTLGTSNVWNLALTGSSLLASTGCAQAVSRRPGG